MEDNIVPSLNPLEDLVVDIHFRLLSTTKHIEDVEWTKERIKKFLIENYCDCSGKSIIVDGIPRSKYYFDIKRNIRDEE